MIPSVRSIAAVALIAAAVPALAYNRETTTPGHPETGLCLWWRERQITYRVNATRASPAPCGSATAADAAAAQGAAAWSSATRAGGSAACTDFKLVQGQPTDLTRTGNDGVNLIVFRSAECSADVVGTDPCAATPGACAAKFNCWDGDIGTIGLTTTSFDASTGELLDADMELNGWDGVPTALATGFYFTCESASAPTCNDPPYGPGSPSGQPGCNWVDLSAVVTHEAGHMLGLDHVCANVLPPSSPYNACPDASSVMVPQVGRVSQRALAADDVDGICKIYPAGGDTLTCLPDGKIPPKKSGGGCSAAGGTGLAGGLLAAALVAWRGRRRRV
ncbi:matrixin family metalloprotease [Anaeromyxobacter oryzae]|uniref:Peptidase M10 metallopeptidase domain-containing protein n=1 Tax=Anaeromyxobacter oryzae TaxID=2918170 RepID=A0ABM7X0H8_9BACT|nr:matrixin family metalloprotease [Anaeromyxobacter oryzae]BDG05233.1 hypothetical protein AMOR_42290 [Anaeromyxobacter oryzae]